MNKLQIKLERLELMLIEDGYNDSNIVLQTIKEMRELVINYTRSTTTFYCKYKDKNNCTEQCSVCAFRQANTNI